MRKYNYTAIYKNFESNYAPIKKIFSGFVKSNSTLLDKYEIEKQIYEAIKYKYPNTKPSYIAIKFIDSFEALIKDIGLYETLKDKVVLVDYLQYENNPDSYKAKLPDKDYIFYPVLLGQLMYEETRNKENELSLKMAYIYLHTIMDEFILDTIKAISYANPQSLKSSKQITHKEILECTNYDEVINLILNSILNKLSRDSYEEKITYLNKRGITPTLEKVFWFDDIILFCEKRNSLTHSKGYVNEVNLQKLKKTKFKNDYNINDMFEISEEDFGTISAVIKIFILDLYKIVLDKYPNSLS